MIRSTCQLCRANIILAPVISGEEVLAVDQEPHPDGNIVLMPAGAMVLPAATAALGQKIGSRRYRAHACASRRCV